MIRRLTAMAVLMAFLAACKPPKPEVQPPETAPPAKVAVAPSGYKPAISPTLEAVRRRGYVACGVHPGLPGFALKDARGAWKGFDVDICRAVAAATVGDAGKVRFVVIGTADRFGALQKGNWTCCPATPPRPSRAPPGWASRSPSSPTTTARASWPRERWG